MKKLLALFTLLFVTNAFAADVGELIIPAFPSNTMSASWNDFNLDEANDQIEYMFQCEEACAIDALCTREGTPAGTPPGYQVSLQGVNTSARADGTIKSSANAKGNITLPGAGNFSCTTLTSSYTCTKGEFLSGVVIYNGSGTINGSNYAPFTYSNQNIDGTRYPMTWTKNDNGGSPVTTYRSGPPIFGYKCGSTYYGFQPQSAAQFDFGANATPDERGNIFTIPSASCSTFKIDKIRATGYLNAAASTIDLVIYEGTTVRQTVTLDTDYDTSGSGGFIEGSFSEGYTFSCGTAYRATLKPASTGGTSTGLWYVDFTANGAMNSLPLGTSMYYTSRTDAGSFSETDTRRAIIDLVLSDVTAPAGSGGLKNHNHVAGGAQ
jgi:hypothetical protein